MRRRIFLTADRAVSVSTFLKQRGFSSSLIKALKACGGLPCRTDETLTAGQGIEVLLPDEVNDAPPTDVRVKIIYEDEDYIAADKPSSMPVHSVTLYNGDTLENVFSGDHGFHVINRLDKDTTGICLIAKHSYAADIVCSKRYTAICCGKIEEPVRIDLPIINGSGRMICSTMGRPSVTVVRPLMCGKDYTLVECTLLTGRRHQIRVHMAETGHPLAGDALYGGCAEHISRQALHCSYIGFEHKVTGERMSFTSPLPKDIADIIKIDNMNNILL
ncbi:MAG: RluA family pseudouridine synthase [Oscillospiraceae bacterium]|nr:RluA family pseudouridine synthase [Oscillospiraceae bacterium]